MQVKNAYNTEEFMQLLNIKSRTTFAKKRKTGVVPPPDLDDTYPRWYQSTIEKHLPGLTTSPST
jgi:hypothetical protein